MATVTIDAGELVLCATNEGGLYEGQKHLARYTSALPRAAQDVWHMHVRHVVLPWLSMHGGYKGDNLRMTIGQMAEAAYLLRRHYEEHIKECEAAA